MWSSRRGAWFVPSVARLALGSAVAMSALLAGGALPAFSSTNPRLGTGTTTVQVPKALCRAGTLGQWGCYALRLTTIQMSSATAQKLEAAGLARPATLSAAAFG